MYLRGMHVIGTGIAANTGPVKHQSTLYAQTSIATSGPATLNLVTFIAPKHGFMGMTAEAVTATMDAMIDATTGTMTAATIVKSAVMKDTTTNITTSTMTVGTETEMATEGATAGTIKWGLY